MLRLVIASANPRKAAEMSDVLNAELGGGGRGGGSGGAIAVAPMPGDLPEVVEDGETLEDNARLKAHAVRAAVLGAGAGAGNDAFVADDTGLFVDALDGAPGVRTARYAGDDADDARNRRKLLDALAGTGTGTGAAARGARFATVVVLVLPDGAELVAEGSVEGSIAPAERGDGGFGYDSLFVPDEGDGRTFAQMEPAEKHAVSHRGRALRALAARLAPYLAAHQAGHGFRNERRR
ncbi:MAG TPA: non-canonical purine NTP pyrophosphatase [Acidimicrobiaceae bacterium]|nr:non-canonical purine NTP pyrophosphatase [Acidimicrobiaceae bacterium]